LEEKRMTRIVKKPREEDVARFSKQFDAVKRELPETTLTQFCKTNKVPYQAMRSHRANQVRLFGSNAIQHSRELRPREKRQDMHPDSVLRLDEEPVKKARKKRQKSVDVFDELDKAYATIGRLVVNGGKL